MRAGTSLMCAAQGASRPHTSALTVQEHVMTRAPDQARVREKNCALTKQYGAYLERVAAQRKGHANALSPWFCNARRCRPWSDFRSLHLHGKGHECASLGLRRLGVVTHPQAAYPPRRAFRKRRTLALTCYRKPQR